MPPVFTVVTEFALKALVMPAFRVPPFIVVAPEYCRADTVIVPVPFTVRPPVPVIAPE